MNKLALIIRPYAIHITLGVIALILLVRIQNKAFGFLSGDDADNSGLDNSLDKHIEDVVKSEPTPQTYSGYQYRTWADSLQSYFEGWTSSSDKEAILSIFSKMRTRKDVVLLIGAYGVRDDESLVTQISWHNMQSDINRALANVSVNYSF